MKSVFSKIIIICIGVSCLAAELPDDNKPSSVLRHSGEVTISNISSDQICLSVPFTDTYDITLFSINGKERVIVPGVYLTKGYNEVPISAEDVANSIYFIQIKSKSECIVSMFIY